MAGATSPRMAKTIEVVTNDTQLATKSFRLFISVQHQGVDMRRQYSPPTSCSIHHDEADSRERHRAGNRIDDVDLAGVGSRPELLGGNL
jgi:hypothetical protein